MKQLEQAMAEEKRYVADRMQGINTSLRERLVQYGYNTLDEYFAEKKAHTFNEWKPEVYYISVDTFAQDVENAINNADYGIYIPVADGLYAYHGTDEIDLDLCKSMGVRVIELNYQGGTIIGSANDFSIEILYPPAVGIDGHDIINKIAEIVSKYVDGVTISGNDLLVNGEKVMGSMERRVGNCCVWAAQISFGEYNEAIEKICNKKSAKKPSQIKRNLLSKDKLEREVLKWLSKA